MSSEEYLAQAFHETYETLAPNFGYETRPESRKPWREVPQQNQDLMVAVCKALIARGIVHVYQERILAVPNCS